jgi:hypothetical protein
MARCERQPAAKLPSDYVRRATLDVVRRALEVGVEFIDENRGSAGVRLRKRADKKLKKK